MSIEDWRVRIDEIDRKLVELLNERTQCVIEIARIKKETNTAVFDPERERRIIRSVQHENHGPLDNDGMQRLFERIFDESRRIERQIAHKE